MWLDGEGKRLIVERMVCQLTQADLYVQRWLHQGLAGDAVALVNILLVEQMRETRGPKFHVAVTDAIARQARVTSARADLQQKLPLGGIQAVPSKKSA